MHPRVLLLAALVVLAGCSASPGSSASDATADADLTTSAETEAELMQTRDSAKTTASPKSAGQSSTRDCRAILYLEAVDRPADDAVRAYGNLSAERKAEFDMALVEGNAELGADGEAFWTDRPYVEHDGSVYRALVSVC